MTIRQFLFTAALVLVWSVSAMSLHADERFGCRIPVTYFVTTGTGESDQGIPPDPYETFSYDLALLDAGIENFNVVYYTSVLPPESRQIPFEEASASFHHGAVLEAIMAKAGSVQGNTVAAGVGRVWAVDTDGKAVGGFAAEYERIYEKKRVDPETAADDAKNQLKASLQHELAIRGLEQKGEMTFDVASLYIKKRYGMALAALEFTGFIYPDADK